LLKLAKEGRFDVIVHGCNCFCTMGAGIAKHIKQSFPAAYAADLETRKGNRDKLGACTFAIVDISGGSLTVVNAYIQYQFRGSGVKADYDAIRSCMKWIGEKFPGQRIGLPKIGAGLAGGDWCVIEKIIEEELGSREVTIVEYQA